MGPEYVAVSVPFLLALGVLVSGGRGRTRPGSAPLAASAVAVGALALIVSLGLPWLADRRLDDAVDAVGAQELARADERAEAAHALNPLSVEPLLLRGTVAEARGEADRAERFYVEAANLQPENPEPWYELGRFTFEVRRNPARALIYLDRSYAIDNFHPDGPRLLNEVRAELEGR
jgi:tetratricopeptide (TPR) repeat protein